MRSVHRSTLTAVVCASVVFFAVNGRAEESPVGLSLSLERVAGVAYASLRPTGASDSVAATTFGIGGPAINPIALPRIGVDALLPIGLTLGGAVGYGHASVSDSPDNNGASQTWSGDAWLFSPRVGYLVHLGPLFDLWPRAGVTFESASLQLADSQSCSGFGSSTGVSSTTCTTSPGESDSLFIVAASLEVAAALRLTRSFNLLGGIAYDHVFAASGSSTRSSSNGSTRSSDVQAQGRYLGAQLWLGLGGYVL